MVKLNDVIQLLKIDQIEMIGSKSDPNLKYFSDVDFQDFYRTKNSYNKIREFFIAKFEEANSNPNIFITDFKSGMYSGTPLRWCYDELKQGFKVIDNFITIKFIDTLTQQSIIKLDLVVFWNNRFVEMTNNYYFDFIDKNRTYKPLTNDGQSQKLLYSYRTTKPTNFYKSLKLLYSYYKHIDNKDMQKILVDLFNSDIGNLNKQLSSLKTIVLLLENKKTPPKVDIIDAINNIKTELNNLSFNDKNLNSLKNLSFKKIINKLDNVIDNLQKLVIFKTNEYIKQHKISNILNPL
ncbi:MAG: hypothetical protein ACW98X_26505 [Promethearchaeota archaeon]|jgi:hypothetical protein